MSLINSASVKNDILSAFCTLQPLLACETIFHNIRDGSLTRSDSTDGCHGISTGDVQD